MTCPRVRTLALISLSALFVHAALLSASGEPTGVVPSKTAIASKPACNRDAFRIIVDVGHTAGNPGAKSARGAYEYDFNLKLATLIDEKLRAAGFSRSVLLITTDNKRRALFERICRPQAQSGDLFLSIHHDSVPDRFRRNGNLVASSAYSDRFKGHSIFVSHDNADYAGSVAFGRLLGQQLKVRGLQYTPHYTEKFMGSRQRTWSTPMPASIATTS